MKKLKGILSIVMVLALLCSSFAFATSVQAADTSKSNTGLEAKLQDDISQGVILHALCWSYKSIEKNIPAIAAAGYSTVQVSPVQQPKDISTSTNVSGQWWKLYQPVSLALAKDSWVGTEADLKSLCTTAHKYNVKVICDVVTNHLGATSDKDYKSQPWVKLADEVKTYEPVLWNSNGNVQGNPYFHNPTGQASDSNANSVTQLVSSKCPDLNTGNSTVQNKVIGLLKQCIDAGADGFRFDAAKHIETPADSGISPNNYWTNIINGANSYAQGKGKTLFYYGEVLNTPGGGRSISGYTSLNGGKYRVTNNKFGNGIRNAVVGKNASGAVPSSYPTELGSATQSVIWAESHDTYLNTDDGGTSNGVSDENIVKTWALVASRKDATPLFFARTNDMRMGQSASNTSYKSVAVSEVNKFHNNFAGQAEKVGTSGSFAYVARGNSGVVIVNVSGTSGSASVSGTGLKDGAYKDMVTGENFTVSGGTVSGKIGSTGVAVVVQSTTTPLAIADQESKSFQGDTITVGLSLSNATSGTYQLDNYTPVTFTGSPKIRLGSDYKAGDTIKLTLTATDGAQTTTNVYEYTKVEAASSGVYIIFPASVVKSNNWKTPIFAYIYDEKTGKGNTVGGQVYKNGAWPGEELEFDSKLNAYYLEVNSKECTSEKTTKVENGVVTGSANAVKSDFNLAASANANVILSDSTVTAEGGKQYPIRGGKAITLAGKTHKLTSLTSSGWQVSTEVPGQSSTVVQATDVTKGNAVVQPTTAKPTEAPVTEPQKETTEPVPVTGDAIYGDVNGDSNVSIKDATVIQKHVAKLALIPADRQPLADVNGDNNISIKDATAIQKYVAKLAHNSKTGQKYGGSVQPATQAPTQAPQPETQAPEPVTEPETDPQPEETYTLYVKSKLSWLSSDGCEPYVYDNASGTSYLMVQDLDAYPQVFKADVPKSVSDVSFYRALAEATPETGYNAVEGLTVSPTNNCIVITEAGKEGTDTILGADVEPYVAEEKPDSISTIYVKNDKNWSSVYLYGWGYGLNKVPIPLEKVSGNIWKIELETPIPNGTETFLFKETEGTKDSDWANKSENVTIDLPNNCYVLSSDSWETYNG